MTEDRDQETEDHSPETEMDTKETMATEVTVEEETIGMIDEEALETTTNPATQEDQEIPTTKETTIMETTGAEVVTTRTEVGHKHQTEVFNFTVVTVESRVTQMKPAENLQEAENTTR